MDRVSKNGHKMMKRNINISSILVLGLKVKWKDKVNYYLLRVRFT